MLISVTAVADINATFSFIKPDLSLTESQNIFEGDRVELICMLPIKQRLYVLSCLADVCTKKFFVVLDFTLILHILAFSLHTGVGRCSAL